MLQKHLVETNICLSFSSFGFRNPSVIWFPEQKESMDQQQKRGAFPQAPQNIPHHTHLNGSRQTWGEGWLKGLSRTIE